MGGGLAGGREEHRPKNTVSLGKRHDLDGRNRAIVIAESLARVIAAIRIASIRWRSYLPRKHKIVLTDPAFIVPRFESRECGVHSFSIRSTWDCGVACATDRIHWTLAIGDWRFCPSMRRDEMILHV